MSRTAHLLRSTLTLLALSIRVTCECAAASESRFSVTLDSTWASKYMTDGYDVAGDHPVWQPSLNLKTPLAGFSLMLWSSMELDRQYQQYDELDFMAKYTHDFFERTAYALNLHGFADYWTYPKANTQVSHEDGSATFENSRGNKFHAGVSATNLIPLWDSHLVPTYNVYYWVYWQQNRKDQYQGGTHHELLLEYYHSVPKFIPGVQYQYAGISGSTHYNDGAFSVQPGWSHSIAQLVTGVSALGCDFSLTLNRQWSYQPSVDPNNELWSTLSFTKEF